MLIIKHRLICKCNSSYFFRRAGNSKSNHFHMAEAVAYLHLLQSNGRNKMEKALALNIALRIVDLLRQKKRCCANEIQTSPAQHLVNFC